MYDLTKRVRRKCQFKQNKTNVNDMAMTTHEKNSSIRCHKFKCRNRGRSCRCTVNTFKNSCTIEVRQKRHGMQLKRLGHCPPSTVSNNVAHSQMGPLSHGLSSDQLWEGRQSNATTKVLCCCCSNGTRTTALWSAN